VQHQEPRKNSPIKESLLGGCWLVRGGWTSINYFVVSLLNPLPRKNSPIKESLLGGCWLVRGGWTSINYFVVSLPNPFS
jgi:hypothetical protein